MASPNISELITTTLNSRTRKPSDCITKNNALHYRLNEKGRVKFADGGSTIYQEMEYAENGATGWYSGYDVLPITPSDVFTSAEFSWKQAAGAIVMSGLEELQNSGKERMIDLLAGRIRNAEKTIKNLVAVGCHSDGTANGGKQIGGLQALISTTPTTGTWGGIDRATWTFARNQKYAGVADGGAAVSATTIQSYMNALWLLCTRGADSPDLIVADNTYYGFYWSSLQAIQRIASDKMAQAGFTTLKFMNADAVFDGGQGGACPAARMYFLNTDYLFLRPHSERNFTQLGGDRMNTNQDAHVRILGWAGNMTMSNAALQGVLFA